MSLKFFPEIYTRTVGTVNKLGQEIVENVKNGELPFVFSNKSDFWTRKNNPVRVLFDVQKMIHQNGGQRISNPSWTFNNSSYCVNRFVHSTKGYTNGLDDCIAVLLHNDNDAYLYHLAPNVHKDKLAIEHMQRGLSNTIQELQGHNKKCYAVLVGGNNSDGSHLLYENISKVLGDKKIKTQEVLFCDGHKSIYYDIEKGVIIDDGLYRGVGDLKSEYKKVVIDNEKCI